MNGQTMHTLPGHPNFRPRAGPWWSLPAIPSGRKLGPLWFLCVRTTGIRCMPICAGAVIRPIRRRISRRSSSSRVLEGRYLDRADPEKGRFRSFLLTSLKFFVADEEDRQRAQKRGGGALLPLEFSSGEERYQREPAHDETPERIFERRWALSVLDRVVERLREEFVHPRTPGAFRAVEGVPSRAVRRAVCRAGSRNEHVGGGAQGGHSPASQEVSRTLSPGNRGYRGRSRGSGVRTPVFGGRADEKVTV